MSEKKYVIDACSLIDAAHSYNMKKKSFSYIWDKFGSEIDNGNLLSSVAVFITFLILFLFLRLEKSTEGTSSG